MSSVDQISISNPAFRIVSLPRELQTADDVAWYVSDIQKFGEVNNITMNQKTAPNGLVFRSATVELTEWNWSNLSISKETLLESRQYILNSYHYDSDGQFVQYHFDNGKPMQHIKIVLDVKDSSNNASTLETKNTWSSIYIPVLPSDFQFDSSVKDSYDLQSEDGLRRFFETSMCLGVVSRVDFVSKSVPDSTATIRSAYVHFENWSDNTTSRYIREQIDCTGEFFVKGHYIGHEFVRFSNRRFIVLKVNRSPIPEANPEANVHQLSARNAELEKELDDLKAKIIMLETMCDTLKEKLDDAHIESACSNYVAMTVNDLM